MERLIAKSRLALEDKIGRHAQIEAEVLRQAQRRV
jgi:hypothetical protein